MGEKSFILEMYKDIKQFGLKKKTDCAEMASSLVFKGFHQCFSHDKNFSKRKILKLVVHNAECMIYIF